MTIETISDVAAFAAKEGTFTNLILFAENEVPEVRPEERPGVEAAREHVLDVFVALLSRCRDELVSRAEPSLQKTMEKNWNRDSSIRDRKRVEFPMLVKSSYVETIYIWIDEEPSIPGKLSLVGEVWVQARRRDALRQVAAQNRPRVVLTDDENLRVIGGPLEEGASLSTLAKDLADVLWQPALDVRTALLAQDR